MSRKILVLFFLFFTSKISIGQIQLKKEVGIRNLYGFYNQILPEEDLYWPIVLLPYYNYYLGKREERRGKFYLYVEPQFTFVFLKYVGTEKHKLEHEVGINGGVGYCYSFNWFMLYTGLGSGPNFISVSTRKQAKGFIFSDNLFVGFKREIKNNYFFDLQVRARHISNAGLKNPNRGINNIFGGIGVSKFF